MGDTTTAAGRMMMQMVGAFAEFEWAMLKERTHAGLEAARKARPDRRPPSEVKASPTAGNCPARDQGQQDRSRRGPSVRCPPGHYLPAAPARLNRALIPVLRSVAP